MSSEHNKSGSYIFVIEKRLKTDLKRLFNGLIFNKMRKTKDSAQEQRSRVTAREVPTEELLQLFSEAFSTKKATENGNLKFNDEIPY